MLLIFKPVHVHVRVRNVQTLKSHVHLMLNGRVTPISRCVNLGRTESYYLQEEPPHCISNFALPFQFYYKTRQGTN